MTSNGAHFVWESESFVQFSFALLDDNKQHESAGNYYNEFYNGPIHKSILKDWHPLERFALVYQSTPPYAMQFVLYDHFPLIE